MAPDYANIHRLLQVLRKDSGTWQNLDLPPMPTSTHTFLHVWEPKGWQT